MEPDQCPLNDGWINTYKQNTRQNDSNKNIKRVVVQVIMQTNLKNIRLG